MEINLEPQPEHESPPNTADRKLSDVVKCSLIKLILRGSDKVLMDGRFRKISGMSLGGDGWQGSASTETSDRSGRRRRGCMQNFFESRKDMFNTETSKAMSFSSRTNQSLPLYLLNLVASLTLSSITFQFSLLGSVLKLPIWLSRMSFLTLTMFSLQILRRLRTYAMKRALSLLVLTYATFAATVSRKVRVQKSFALRVGMACLRSIWISTLLLGLLISGFVFGGFVMQHLVEKPIQLEETLIFDYTKTNPVAFVPIAPYSSKYHPHSLVYDHNLEAQKKNAKRVIPDNRKLQLIVSLTLPASDYNRELGIFQVKVEFLSANGTVTSSRSQPSMLRFKSQPIRLVEALLKSAPILAGWQLESQVLKMKMNELREGSEATVGLKVTLERRAGQEASSAIGVPQVYAASLALETELPQPKRLIWCWRRSIFVWISVMTFLMNSLIVLLTFRPIRMTKRISKISYDRIGRCCNIISINKKHI